jgi:hypothetical protein
MMKNLFSFLLFIAITNSVLSQNIVINEILSSNSFSNMDEDGSYQDWIELYNNGTTTINLSGYGLSDDATILFKWTFPSVSMAPGTYLLVWASDKNRTVAGNPLHTNFKLAMAGNAVLLSANDNANFKVRLRFIGPNLTLDTGNRVTYNNIAVDGVQLPLQITDESSSKYKIFPNPFSDVINITELKKQPPIRFIQWKEGYSKTNVCKILKLV